EVGEPWLVEKRLLSLVPLPLNLMGNAHPFVPTLRDIRRASKKIAHGLPVVADNGGPPRTAGCGWEIRIVHSYYSLEQSHCFTTRRPGWRNVSIQSAPSDP